jgi:polysaccharide deacetylase family protein (PEP-CTERM system associated)
MVKNILTIDVEDWFQSSLEILGPEYSNIPRPIFPSKQVIKNTQNVLRILSENRIHATFFVLGTVAEVYPELVQAICAARHDVGTHGYNHELVYNHTQEMFRDDLQRSIKLLESITGERVSGYRAPYFSITAKSNWALTVLAELGFKYDSSIFPVRRRLYGFNSADCHPHFIHTTSGDLWEFPISIIKLFGQNFPIMGGGYFRLLPYSFVKQAIKAINSKGKSVVFYMHPYELDEEELRRPLLQESMKTRFVRFSQRVGRNKTEAKLRQLLTDFKWISIKDWIIECQS